ncbi:hypothetical protein O7626_30730 [Micromonospora sp. WMMD1102]|uniref:hypothetical protein n=1 Tax=Micromonospora sp. WMMD1102 TaxID=3016105 RepID=UPI002414EAC6|nr:hypothetical protein [Micromonospora sp. WMMD1102]MDG4790248.1 hypothetical protein [Micromonospora sp. WMMD1102]
MAAPAKPTKTQNGAASELQYGVLIFIVLLVGSMAGAASFSHVHDWTMENSPTGTGDWFGWANAVITELIPVAALIVIAIRRRTGGPIGYPMFLLVVAVGLSLTAQLAVAEPTVFGWMVSALPALAFFALSKLVFTVSRPTTVTAEVPATVAPASSPTDIPAAPTVSPAAAPTPATQPQPIEAPNPATPGEADSTTGSTEPPSSPDTERPTPRPEPAPDSTPTNVTGLLPGARTIVKSHRQVHGEDITPGQLAVRLRVPTNIAADILTALNQPATNTQPHNGKPVGATA